MSGRTYRFFSGKPLYPFGYGLSYTSFRLTELEAPKTLIKDTGDMEVSTSVANSGSRDGDEVLQLYLKAMTPPVRAPRKTLVGFQRVHLRVGERKTVSFKVKHEQFDLYADDGKSFIAPGQYEFQIGTSSDDVQQSTSIIISKLDE